MVAKVATTFDLAFRELKLPNIFERTMASEPQASAGTLEGFGNGSPCIHVESDGAAPEDIKYCVRNPANVAHFRCCKIF